ncbi:MAG: DNA repair protein RadA, partial [Tannerella sp.]|nr:DNA repair protein RadA [Tannerella sp.]
MSKEKSIYVCTDCGAESLKWTGKCPACGAWNTYKEEIIRKEVKAPRVITGIERSEAKPLLLRDVTSKEEVRLDLQDGELNRVLGGGLVKGSLVLIGGEPGIGKSTLVLQTVLKLKNIRTMYVSGEESAQQLKLR